MGETISPWRGNRDEIKPSHDGFVLADTKLPNETRYGSFNSNNVNKTGESPEQKTTIIKNNPNVVRATASEQKALTCFTIDAILNKDGDKTALKTNYGEDATAVFDTNNVKNSALLKLHQCGEAKTTFNACKDDRESSKYDKVKQTSPSPDFGGSHFATMTNESPSRDSGVFLESDAGPLSPCTPASNFIWMPPSVPCYPFCPVSVGNISPTAGLSYPQLSYGGIPSPVPYFMLDHMVTMGMPSYYY